ncbi:YHS domain-containing (seleno)protein [Flavobacterium sp.]|uniref:YHS domain-containing (seleno)protein n=1 Tax=Flavobacterium sp. TaxID=239 RepID=UPI00262CD0B9|nr:YHS domain-containing (seleno)protein [Flavobacterium sp.]
MKLRMVLLWLVAGMAVSYAQQSADKISNYNVEKGLALEGYDPVSYFSNGGPQKGDAKFKASFRGVTYYFKSEANQKLFLADAKKYVPQYGGWCAYAMGATGEKVEVDVKTFKILDGKLYLFYNAYFNNTLKSWNKDEKNLKTKADANWRKINQ